MRTSAVPPWMHHSTPKPEAPFSIHISFELEAPPTPSLESDASECPNLDNDHQDLIKRCFVSVLETCIHKLYMLGHLYTSKVSPTTIKEMPYVTVEERYGKSRGDFGGYCLGSVYTYVHKLQKEVSVILLLLETMVEEARKWGTLTVGKEMMSNMRRMRSDDDVLIRRTREKFDMFQAMKRSQMNERYLSSTVVRSFSDAIKDNQRKAQDVIQNMIAEVRYVQEWENARYEQNHLRLQMAQSAYRKTVVETRWKIDLENTCHEQLGNFITECQQDYMDSIHRLMDDYEATLEQKEVEIYDMKMRCERQTEAYESLQAEFERRTQAMEDWVQNKQHKKEMRRLLQLQTVAAIKIQRWWRAVVARRLLKKGKGKGKGRNVDASKKKTKKKKR